MFEWWLEIKIILKTLLSRSRRFFSLSLLLSAMCFGCNDISKENSSPVGQQSFLEITDVKVPIFSTAENQLNYTRSWFADIQDKRAALRAFLQLYPEEKKLCGIASLDLAYLQLGLDYRFAKKYAGLSAIEEYTAVVEEFNDIPSVKAKAQWYIGWIYTNILHDKEEGINLYEDIVRNYPEEPVSRISHAPWVSIIYPEDDKIHTPLFDKPANHWGALALLEIIRHSEGEKAWQAFRRLWQKYRNEVAVGLGLKVILQKRLHTEEALIMAQQYMENNYSNIHLLGDIRKEINNISHMRDDASG